MIISLEEYITEAQFWQGLGEIKPFYASFQCIGSVFWALEIVKKVDGQG
jgi:hypothetical protein